MAIISIPSSIGGIAIPGSATNGPLGMLFGKKGGQGLQYPRDLGSATRAHAVQFEIYEVLPATYDEKKEYDFKMAGGAAVDQLGKVGSAAYDAAKTAFSGTTGNLGLNATAAGAMAGVSTGAKTLLELSGTKKKKVETINLYMPETVTFAQDYSYNDVSLKDAIQNAVEGVASRIPKVGGAAFSAISATSAAIDSDAAKLILKSQGLAINPMNQLVFQGINFREFQMAFTFTPYSKQEADTVKKIIKAFRENAAPIINKGMGGMFFIPPSVINIKFMYKGKENPNVPKVTEAAITNIDVNFAPNGWAAHTDGAPVQTTMTISFRENALIDRAKIKEGY